MGPRAGVDGRGKSRPPTRIRSPDLPARSESLYRLRHPASGASTTIKNMGGRCLRQLKHNAADFRWILYILSVSQVIPDRWGIF